MKVLDPFLRARKHAFLLLKFRQRSRAEIAERLKKKKFNQQVIDATLEFLSEKKFIDDAAFARAWAIERIKKPLGIARIRQELLRKGISASLVSAVLAEAEQQVPQEEMLRELAQKMFRKTRSAGGRMSDARARARRVSASLIRKGFPPNAVWEIVSEYAGTHSED